MLEIVVIPLKPYAGFGPRQGHNELAAEHNGDQRSKAAT
jgi:hypothetical protein